jgi:hypothetical protein
MVALSVLFRDKESECHLCDCLSHTAEPKFQAIPYRQLRRICALLADVLPIETR